MSPKPVMQMSVAVVTALLVALEVVVVVVRAPEIVAVAMTSHRSRSM
jgi:hypothetical protein